MFKKNKTYLMICICDSKLLTPAPSPSPCPAIFVFTIHNLFNCSPLNPLAHWIFACLRETPVSLYRQITCFDNKHWIEVQAQMKI